MTEKANSETIRDLPHEDVSKAVSRRNFIKGVITSGVAVSSAGYLFRASSLLHGQESGAGAGERLITLNVNGQQRRVDAALQAGPHRHQAGMRPRGMRILHCADRRYSVLFVFGTHPYRACPKNCDH